MEQANDRLEIEKGAHERTTHVQKKQLSDQLKILSDSLTVEKDAREKWIDRYELEHKKYVELNLENVAAQAKIKELEYLKTENEGEIKRNEQTIEKYRVKNGSMIKAQNDLERKLDDMTRSYKSAKGLLESEEMAFKKREEENTLKIKSLINEKDLEIAKRHELENEIKTLSDKIFSLETKIKELDHKIEKQHSDNEFTESLNESLRQQLEEKQSNISNILYEKEVIIEDLKVQKEMYENSQMEVEDYNVKYNNLVNENLELKEKEELLHHTQTKLANIKHKTEKDKKNAESQTIQSDTKSVVNKATITDPMDDIPDMNEPSLVNTLTTSLGGIATHALPLNNAGFIPSPINNDSSGIADSNKGSVNNKLKSYLRSNKEKHGREIVEQDESDITRISYSTKHANAPNKLNFSIRHSNLSPISSHKKHMGKRNKDAMKKKKKIKKHIKDNAINESIQRSISSKRSDMEKDDQELLKSVYVMMNPEGTRPMTVPYGEKLTVGTKYEDGDLRDSVVNIDKSEDSEFFNAQVFMKPIKDSARGWSSKNPRRRHKEFGTRDQPVVLKKQPVDVNARKQVNVSCSKQSAILMSAASQCYSRPVSQKISTTPKVWTGGQYDILGKGSIKNLIRIATSQK